MDMIKKNMDILNIMPSELLFEVMKYLDAFSIVDFTKATTIPKSIINLPVLAGAHNVLECVFMVDYLDNTSLIKKLVKDGADALVKNNSYFAFKSLWGHYQMKFITDEKFHEIYNILFPNDLSFTRSGKCYSGIYHTLRFKCNF
jgi:hypothetical protein